MAATIRGGPHIRVLSRDSEGHREYRVTHLVETSDQDDGPQVVMNTPGLPVIGATWNFGNDSDVWAFCWPDMEIRTHEPGKAEPTKWWEVEQVFNTKPLTRCQDERIEDPLLEPPGISGSFSHYTEEAIEDKDGEPILSSSHESYHGPQVEFDASRPSVRIEQNVAQLGLSTFTPMVDTVNDAPLWGMEAREVKLSDVRWKRKLYGVCNFYFTRVLDFDVKEGTFDRELTDEGTKVLHGHWAEDTGEYETLLIGGGGPGGGGFNGVEPDPDDPTHFDRYKDRNGENLRVLLNGAGLPATSGTSTGTGTGELVAKIQVQKYGESNFLLLGIPINLES